MAAASSIIGAIGAAAAVGGGIAANVQQNKARAEARYRMGIEQENYKKALEQQQKLADAQMREAERVHNANMQHMQKSLEADESRFAQQLAQSERGLQMQQQAMNQSSAVAERALNNQKAQLERQINADNAAQNVQRHKKEDEGVAGTLLTGPGGVEKDKLKLGKKTLLGQ